MSWQVVQGQWTWREPTIELAAKRADAIERSYPPARWGEVVVRTHTERRRRALADLNNPGLADSRGALGVNLDKQA